MRLEQTVDPEVTASSPVKDSRSEQSGFLRQIWERYASTLAQQVLTAGLGLISGLLTPRLLGPHGRGELAAIILWPLALMLFCSAGTSRATVFFAAKHRENVSTVASTCLILGTAQSLLVVLVGLAVIPVALRSHGAETVKWSLIFLCSVPILRTVDLLRSLFLGTLNVKWYNVSLVIPSACYALSIAVLFFLKFASIPMIIVCQLAGYAMTAWLALQVVKRKLQPSWQPDRIMMKGLLRYSFKGYFGETTSFMNQRLDQLLISLFLPSAQLGIYVAAVAITDGLLILPRGIGIVTLAAGSNSETAGALRVLRRSILLTFLWLAPASGALWVLSPIIIPRLFGAAFGLSVLPCRILILGSCAMGFGTVLSEWARSVNRPEIPSYAELLGLVVTVSLMALLLKPYGIAGAAVASSVAYTATLIFAAVFLFRTRVANPGEPVSAGDTA